MSRIHSANGVLVASDALFRRVPEEEDDEEEEKDDYIERFRYDVSNVYVDLKKIDRATERSSALR